MRDGDGDDASDNCGGWWLWLAVDGRVVLLGSNWGCCEKRHVEGYRWLWCMLSRACVQEITGEFVLSFSSEKAVYRGLGGLSLTSDEKHLLVCDKGNHRVVVSDARNGRALRSLQGDASRGGLWYGGLGEPAQAILVPKTGQVLVVDSFFHRVMVFAGLDDDAVVRMLGDGQGEGPREFNCPLGLVVLDGDVADAAAPDGPVAVVADSYNHRLAVWRLRNGTVIRHVGSQGAAPGQFNRPTAVTVLPAWSTGTDEAWLVVADSKNDRVQVLTRTWTVVRVLQGDSVIKLGGWLSGVTVCVGTGQVLLTDRNNHRVVSWRLSDGGGLRVVCGGVLGLEPGQLAYPEGIQASSDGLLWVADGGSQRLSLFH